MADDWTAEQNDAIVADYFAMLAADVAGQPYSKADHNRLLQPRILRGRGSIEWKHQNISAVLKGLGEDWLPGYKPRFNFQTSLVDAVARWLGRHPNWLARATLRGPAATPLVGREDGSLWIGPPPTQSNAPPPDELEQRRSRGNTMSPSAMLPTELSVELAKNACWLTSTQRCPPPGELTLPSVSVGCLTSMVMAPATISRVSIPTAAID